MIGLRVGPFEITEAASVPESGDWYRAKRTGMTRRKPQDVLVQVVHPDASHAERGQLQLHYDNLRGVEDARVPEAVAIYEGIGAIAISGVYGDGLDRVVDARRTNAVVMTPATLLDVLLEVAETLQHAHHRGRCHGHLSAENIWLSPEGQVWIFGFAAGSEAEISELWNPPERARGELATEATDQWSLAALAAALITGRVPWRNADQAQAGDPEQIVEPVERQWPALARLLRKMLDNRPSNRYPTMHQVRQQLLALSRKAGGTSDRRSLGMWLNDRASDSDAPVMFTAEVDDNPAPSEDSVDTVDGENSDTAPTQPVVAPEEETLSAFDEIKPPPATFADADPPSQASNPDIPEARAISASTAPSIPKAAHAPLPSEDLPVVRPDNPNEVPEATEIHVEETAETEQIEPVGGDDAWNLNAPDSVVDRDEPAAAIPEPAFEDQPTPGPAPMSDPGAAAMDDPSDADADATPSQADEPADGDAPEAEPESLAIKFDEDAAFAAAQEAEGEDDYEATVLFGNDLLAAELAAAGFALVDGQAVPVEVQVTPTDAGQEGFKPTPTMVPTTDSRDPSEELKPNGDPATSGDPSSAGWLPKNVVATGNSGPALGNANVTMGHEPVLPSGEDGPPVPPLPPREISFEQKAAVIAVALMVMLFLLWVAKTTLL